MEASTDIIHKIKGTSCPILSKGPEIPESLQNGGEGRRIPAQAVLFCRGLPRERRWCYNDTTAVRLIPVYGKGVGESVEFGGLLGHAPIMPVSEHSCAAFIPEKSTDRSPDGESTPCFRITAVGTNAIATSAMLKAGAEAGATGENAVLVACRSADIIAGPIGILAADSLMGEITAAMAVAVGSSPAKKLLLPVNHCNNLVAGTQSLSLSRLMDEAVELLRSLCTGE